MSDTVSLTGNIPVSEQWLEPGQSVQEVFVFTSALNVSGQTCSISNRLESRKVRGSYTPLVGCVAALPQRKRLRQISTGYRTVKISVFKAV